MLQQFISIIDNAMVMRYNVNKETEERELSEVVKPGYILGTKQRVMLDIINKAKNYILPIVIVSISGISFNKERQASKNIPLNVNGPKLDTVYARPTPIQMKVEVTILTKYMTDLYQIYGKLATQFQPAISYSWFVPQTIQTNWVELRNKIEWDGELSLDIRTEAKNSDEDKFTGKMNFTIDGWLFPTMNECANGIIYNIGTTVVPSEDAIGRIYDEIGLFRPLVHSVLKNDNWKFYNNPRQFATAHPLISNIYLSKNVGSSKCYFILDKQRAKLLHVSKDAKLVIHGYNFKNIQVVAIPSKETHIKNAEYITMTYTGELHPWPNEKVEKYNKISGYLLNTVKQDNNTIIVDFNSPLELNGEFDIAVISDIDYDILSKRKGFKLIAE
jgi:hypothetical protein